MFRPAALMNSSLDNAERLLGAVGGEGLKVDSVGGCWGVRLSTRGSSKVTSPEEMIFPSLRTYTRYALEFGLKPMKIP